MSTTRQQARKAGALYLLLAVTAPFGLLYVPGRVVVSGNATVTADNIRSAEWVLRAGVASELFHQVVFVYLVLALYQLFKPVSETYARQLVIFGALLSVPIVFVNVLNDVAALTLVSGARFLVPFDKPQLDALAYLFVRLHGYGITVVSIFWGLWLFPFGILVVRSGFIPKWLGIALMLAGAAYVVQAFATLVVPQSAALVSSIASPLQFGEIPIIFWLLIWGTRQPPAAQQP